MKLVSLMVVLAAFTAGCASTNCDQKQTYQQSSLTPALQAPEGLTIPTPGATYRIPPVQNKKQRFLYEVPDPEHKGQKVKRCLAMPPGLPENKGNSLPSKAPEPGI